MGQFETIYLPRHPSQQIIINVHDVGMYVYDSVYHPQKWWADTLDMPSPTISSIGYIIPDGGGGYAGGMSLPVVNYLKRAFTNAGITSSQYYISPSGFVNLGYSRSFNRRLSDYLSYIYSHAASQNYTGDARKKGIYMVPHPSTVTWKSVATTTRCEPRYFSFIPIPNPTQIMVQAAYNLGCSVWGWQTCLASSCIWSSRVNPGTSICASHKRALQFMQKYIARCDVCGHYMLPSLEMGAKIWVSCTYCPKETRYYCPTCLRFGAVNVVKNWFGMVTDKKCTVCHNSVGMTYNPATIWLFTG
jgi:hypothetical protein